MDYYRVLIKSNHPEKLKEELLDEMPIDYNGYHRYKTIDSHGQTLLTYAIRRQRTECAMVIATSFDEDFINIKETSNLCNTALHLAVKHENFKLVEFLVKQGANIATRNERRELPISLARGQYKQKLKFISFLKSMSYDEWKKFKWSPRIHLRTPPDFRNEAFMLVKINWRLKILSKDTLGLVLEALLEMYRKEFSKVKNEKEKVDIFKLTGWYE